MLHRIAAFLRFYRSAKVVYDLHGPTAYQFAVRILEDRRHYYRFEEIEKLRKTLLQAKEVVPPSDWGAGSKKRGHTLADIVRHSACSPALGRMLFKTSLLYRPQTLLELGSSLGLSALYLSGGALQARFRGIEGHPYLCRKAEEHLKQFNTPDARVLCGAFRQKLPEVLKELGQVDLVYFDGDHRHEATLELFRTVLPHRSENAVFVFDDIHWSKGMSRAWEEIRHQPEVKLSIDIWRAGFLFFGRHLKTKQSINLAPRWWKPWRLGFFQ